MRFAYADPPYIGQAKKHYSHYEGGIEVDHEALIARLMDEYADGWALSAGAVTVRQLYPIMPEKVRMMIWTKRLVFFKPGVNPCYGWEPVFVYGGRKRTRAQFTAYDWIEANATFKRGLSGAKPDKFFLWLFEILNVSAGDTLDDLFPGTGRLAIVLDAWRRQKRLPLTALKTATS